MAERWIVRLLAAPALLALIATVASDAVTDRFAFAQSAWWVPRIPVLIGAALWFFAVGGYTRWRLRDARAAKRLSWLGAATAVFVLLHFLSMWGFPKTPREGAFRVVHWNASFIEDDFARDAIRQLLELNADDAVRTLRLARELLDGHDLVKLEVLGDPHTLYPNMAETLRAAETLVRDGFDVMVYCSDDPIMAKQLEEIGCVAVMPLASLIGSGMGILNPWNLQIIIGNAKVPVIVDAGVGTASDAAIAMELGCDGVLMNTAIAAAQQPVLMASAMRKAVEAGREAFLAGRMPKKLYSATPSSPTAGLITPGKPA